MPESIANPKLVSEVQAVEEDVRRFLDELFGATQESEWESARVRKVTVSCKVRPETRRRLEAIAKMNPGFEEQVGTLIGRLLDGFVQGHIPCCFCGHPYPLKVKRTEEGKR